MNHYYTSDGEALTDAQIKRRYSQSKKGARQSYWCESCRSRPAQDCSHTISQKRCKELHKTELIWDEDNWSWDCRTCHSEWESYKSGKNKQHHNYELRMAFIKKHDIEGYEKRLNFSS